MRKRIALFGGALFAADMMQMSDSDSKKDVTFTALVLGVLLAVVSGAASQPQISTDFWYNAQHESKEKD